MTHWNGCFLWAPLHRVGVEEDISAAPLAVLIDYQSDLTGLQLGDWPAGWGEKINALMRIRVQVKTKNMLLFNKP